MKRDAALAFLLVLRACCYLVILSGAGVAVSWRVCVAVLTLGLIAHYSRLK